MYCNIHQGREKIYEQSIINRSPDKRSRNTLLAKQHSHSTLHPCCRPYDKKHRTVSRLHPLCSFCKNCRICPNIFSQRHKNRHHRTYPDRQLHGSGRKDSLHDGHCSGKSGILRKQICIIRRTIRTAISFSCQPVHGHPGRH